MSRLVELKDITITNVNHHRNGVSGQPFYVVQFICDEEPFFAVVFDYHKQQNQRPENPYIAVFRQDLAGEGNFIFGQNSFRGDAYVEALYEAISNS